MTRPAWLLFLCGISCGATLLAGEDPGSISNDEGEATPIKLVKPAANPFFGMRWITVLAEQKLMENPEIRQRVERYAEDVRSCHGTGVEVLAVSSSSPRYIKGLLRERMEVGLAGAVFIGAIPRAMAELHASNGTRDVFSCDLYYMDQNTRATPEGGWTDPGWHDEGRDGFRSLGSERVPQIHFDWGNGSPKAGVPDDYFSIRYKGSIVAPRDGQYTFTIRSDNGRRLIIGGEKIIDKWEADWGKDYSGTIRMNAGALVPIELNYFEQHGGANVHLYWTLPGESRPTLVPATAFRALRAEYFNNTNLKDEQASPGEKRFANNGLFDRVSDGTPSGAEIEVMAPDIFVSRIETHTSRELGDEIDLLKAYFDKNHDYWCGKMALGKRAVATFGEGSKTPDPGVVARLLKLFPNDLVTARANPSGPTRYLADIQDPDTLVSLYCGHGYEGGISLGLESRQMKGVAPKALLVDLSSCSPLRTIRVTAGSPNGENLSSFIGGAHLYADMGKGNCLAVKGASKTSGGNQREEFFYSSLAKGRPVGMAFLDWTKDRFKAGGNPAEWFDWFYPQELIGDPMIVVGPAPHHTGAD